MTPKQEQFNRAMRRFDNTPYYQAFHLFVATANVSLQVYLMFTIGQLSIGPLWQLVVFFAAYLVTDFVNGLVHMYMDHNDHYEWVGGPLVASFHLHHKRPQYTPRPLALVYFFETGAKVWLVFFLGAVALLASLLSPLALYFLLYVGVLSSLAEVSHYLCHNSNSPWVEKLASVGILLSKDHHAQHHSGDNANYAFLNGFSDPLINRIAGKVYPGYKETTDLHYAGYIPSEGEAR